MELYLNKNSPFVDVEGDNTVRLQDDLGGRLLVLWTWKIPLEKPSTNFKTLVVTPSNYSGVNPWSEEFIKKLEEASAKYQKEKGDNSDDGLTSEVKVRVHGFICDMLMDDYSDGNNKFALRVQIGIKDHLEIDSADIPVSSKGPLGPAPPLHDDVCIRNEKYFEANLPDGSVFHRHFISPMSGTINVIILSRDTLLAADRTKMLEICQNILEDEVQTDVTIVTKDGKELGCNKAFLAAHSPVFDAMFEKSMMKEAETGRIEMVDMVEVDVRAFLKYLYYMDVSAPSENSSIAFKLLQAGHKYEIPQLEKEMGDILSVKPAIWCEVQVALELFLFARQIENHDDDDDDYAKLKMRAVEVLKLKAGDWSIESLKKLGLEDMELVANVVLELFQLMPSAEGRAARQVD